MSCGVRIDAVPLPAAVEELVRGSGPRAVHLCNAYTLSLATRDPRYLKMLNAGHRNLPDGAPLVWIARRLGLKQMSERVYGPDLMSGCIDVGREVGTRHYLYGGTEEVLTKLESTIRERWPGAQLVGAEAPPFRDLSDDEITAAAGRMREAGADVVWVGLGTPKQDWAVDRLAGCGSARFVAVGAAFDFIAGTKRQAPAWIGRSGFEWLYRLLLEPRRLWKRYLVGNSVFVWHNLRRRPRLVSE